MYSDMVATTQRIPQDFEFKRFVQRNNSTLIDPSVPQRSLSNITFPNQDHISTQPLISGFLERKSRAALKGYSTNYYVVTRSKYLHEFKDDDDYRKDPTPELSLYLPDCTVGGISGEKFNIKGKDASKGKVGSTLAMRYVFCGFSFPATICWVEAMFRPSCFVCVNGSNGPGFYCSVLNECPSKSIGDRSLLAYSSSLAIG